MNTPEERVRLHALDVAAIAVLEQDLRVTKDRDDLIALHGRALALYFEIRQRAAIHCAWDPQRFGSLRLLLLLEKRLMRLDGTKVARQSLRITRRDRRLLRRTRKRQPRRYSYERDVENGMTPHRDGKLSNQIDGYEDAFDFGEE